jgi:hypothetical protein
VAVAAPSVLAADSPDDRSVLKVEQGAHILVGDEHNVAAMPPIAARRATLGPKFLPAKGHSAITAVAGLDWKHNFIHEPHGATLAQAIALAN